MIHLKTEQLLELLKESYQAGWHGTLELKDSVIDLILIKADNMSKLHSLGLNSCNAYSQYQDSSQISYNQLFTTGLDFSNEINMNTITVDQNVLDNINGTQNV